jgi:glutamate/tyrosine decarboxylase-like PLP-dependent enzyme
MDDTLHRYLAWFLGPKAENADIMEAMLLQILRDYVYWRKNYFPGDPILINRNLQRQFEDEHDSANQRLHELMAELRRNFPFYSPRYVAHELSDTLMSSVLGYIAGMLFNPNNVTPEAAPVTTELEIDACNAILEMLGYKAPPPIPPADEDPRKYYERLSAKEFGWSHITSGGTVANIEALWVARQVRYFPLAVKHAAKARNLDIRIKLPSAPPQDTGTDIRDVDDYQLLVLKPNEAIYLLSKYVTQVGKAEGIPQTEFDRIGQLAWKYINASPYAPSRGTGTLFSKFQPVILVAGSSHYSINKAADIIGVGPANILSIRTDSRFRMDVADLERVLDSVIRKKQVPLCVIATAGTTEEGAVDPIDHILDLRAKFEKERNVSFWLHIDAAWGGFIRSLFCLEPKDKAKAMASKITGILGLEASFDGGLSELLEPDLTKWRNVDLLNWHQCFAAKVLELAKSSYSLRADDSAADSRQVHPQATLPTIMDGESDAGNGRSTTKDDDAFFQKMLETNLQKMEGFLKSESYREYMGYLKRVPSYFAARELPVELPESFALTLADLNNLIQRFVSDEIEITAGGYNRKMSINWPYRFVINEPHGSVGAAFMAFPKAESITVDPHKMGYAPYPCGCIAFKNDLVRLFVSQRTPYISSTKPNAILHLPPRHADLEDGINSHRIVIDAFSPFILEGSKPGAAAASLWLSIRTTPLTALAHGLIVRGSLLGAREIYEWLTKWNEALDFQKPGLDYEFVSLTPDPPDTNLVTFVVKKKGYNTLADMNKLTKMVYDRFTIQAELGERQYSYSQPFFLSKSTMDSRHYGASCLENFFQRCKLNPEVNSEYEALGLVVLRATVMNPYLNASRTLAKQDYARKLVEELAIAARQSVRSI